MNKKVFILGCSSFAGATFVNYLLNKKFKVYGSYNKEKNNFYLPYKQNNHLKNFKNYKIDLLKTNDHKKLLKLIKKIKPSIIVDFASICMVQESWLNPDKYFSINVVSKSILLKKIYEYNFIEKFIYISTPEIFGSSEKYISENFQKFSPSTPYAISKMAAEMLIKNYNQNYKKKGIITRFSNFYGPGQPNYRLIPKLILSIKQGKIFPIDGKGNSKRNFIFSDDFSEGIFKTMQIGKPGKIYHFSGKKLVSVKNVVKLVCQLMKVNYSKVAISRKDRIGKDKTYKLRSDQSKKNLNWNSKIVLKKGIKSMIDFMNQNYKSLIKYPLIYKN